MYQSRVGERERAGFEAYNFFFGIKEHIGREKNKKRKEMKESWEREKQSRPDNEWYKWVEVLYEQYVQNVIKHRPHTDTHTHTQFVIYCYRINIRLQSELVKIYVDVCVAHRQETSDSVKCSQVNEEKKTEITNSEFVLS